MKGYTPIHVMADCEECEYFDDNYQTAQKGASYHHRKTGHTVHVEVGYMKRYQK